VELHRIRGALYCGGWGIELDDGTFCSKYSINDEVFLYDDLNKAIEACVKNNTIDKVKVKRRGLQTLGRFKQNDIFRRNCYNKTNSARNAGI
jgi:hypothetical protein